MLTPPSVDKHARQSGMRKGNPRILFHTKEQVRVGPLHGVPEQEGKDTMNRANTFLEKKITESSIVCQKQRPPCVRRQKAKNMLQECYTL